jgi:hypothetical protein
MLSKKNMPKSISAQQKKKGRGRPPTGVTPMVGLRMPRDMREQMEKLAREEGVTLSKKILQVLAEYLRRKSK